MAAAEASIEELELSDPPCLHTISAFLSMEPPDVVISFARDCGKGLITERLQHFIWIHCINRTDVKPYPPYLRSFLKKLIFEIESSGEVVIDELYEKYVYQTSMKGSVSVKENERLSKRISFLFPRDCSNLPSCPKSRKLEVLLHCSVNLLEGDTGCSIWPSCLFLSEFILSFPEIFANKSCFEVGSGVGLVGICLAHVKASKVILSDGDLLTLANMKLNLESNKITARNHLLDHTIDSNTQSVHEIFDATFSMDHPKTVFLCFSTGVQCLHLPWESAAENGLQQINPDIVLGADVIYDPLCLPHLIRVLAILLNQDSSNDGSLGKSTRNNEQNDANLQDGLPRLPVAYIASVVRNIDTFNCFLTLADEANLSVLDITERAKPFDLLPYAKSYQQSSIRMLCVSYLSK